MNSPSNSREAILNNLRNGRELRPVDAFAEPEWNSPVFPMPDNLLETFKFELEAISGKVVVGNSEEELLGLLVKVLKERNVGSLYCLDGQLKMLIGDAIVVESSTDSFFQMEAAITRCECLVARTGTVVVSSAHESGRRLNVYPPIHIVWAHASQLVPFVDDALAVVAERYGSMLPSQITFVTGASRTADIEKTLVMGAHGPKELIVLVDASK